MPVTSCAAPASGIVEFEAQRQGRAVPLDHRLHRVGAIFARQSDDRGELALRVARVVQVPVGADLVERVVALVQRRRHVDVDETLGKQVDLHERRDARPVG